MLVELKFEVEKVKKELKSLQLSKDNLLLEINNLSSQKVKYINEIPHFKILADSERDITNELLDRNSKLKEQLSCLNNQIKDLTLLVNDSKSYLEILKNDSDKLYYRLSDKNKEYEKRLIDIKERESSLLKAERLFSIRENEIINADKVNSQKEILFTIKEDELNQKINKLELDIEFHEYDKYSYAKNLEEYSNNLMKLEEDNEILSGRIKEFELIVRKNVDLKSELLAEKNKLNEEIIKTKSMQDSLSRNIEDLDNKEKKIKIMELRIKKMAHDAGLNKEIKELEESLK